MANFAKRTYSILHPSSTNSIYLETTKDGCLKVTIESHRCGWDNPELASINLTPEIARNVRDLINQYLDK